MLRIIVGALLCSTVLCANQTYNELKRNFVYNTYKYDTRVIVTVNNNTQQIMDFYEDSDEWEGYPTRVHVSTNDTLTVEYPIFVTATQQKGVASWEIPLIVQTQSGAILFSNLGLTLCPHDAGPGIKMEHRPLLEVTTASPHNVSLDIKVRRVTDFYVDINKEVPLNVTPSSPKYFYFSFDNQPVNVSENGPIKMMPRSNHTHLESVLLKIDSDDDLCATISIQNHSCPVFSSEMEVFYRGYFLTMMTKGGITLTRAMYPQGFYIVFIVNQNDDVCTGAKDVTGASNSTRLMARDDRMKSFRFRVMTTISHREYVVGVLVTLALVFVVALLVPFAMFVCSFRCNKRVLVTEGEPVITHASRSGEASSADSAPILGNTDDNREGTSPPMFGEGRDSANSTVSLNGSNNVPEASTSGEANSSTENTPTLNNTDATKEDRQRFPPATSLARRSNRYFWGALTVAIVYALPVVQLLVMYQRIIFQTGNHDLCYYNFLCAHPVGFLADFNHVFSNIGYVLLGLVFMIQVFVRQRRARAARDQQGMGLPQHFGLLYSMGLGLVMEGLLSACYHLCPNSMNFQFDSSFMYVIAVLVMIKLYENRNSDIVPRAHSTFMILAFIMTLCLFGILYPSVVFSTIFTIIHLLACLLLTVKIYYADKFKFELSAMGRGANAIRTNGWHAVLPPLHPKHAIFLLVVNLANWSFAIYSASVHDYDFASKLLAILMGNAILYTMFYIFMKIVHGEKIPSYTQFYFGLALIAWTLALKMFLDAKTLWSETPAQSRRLNEECTILQLYDSHDAWHLLSAAAMFLSFNMLLTVDDHVANIKRDRLIMFQPRL